MTCCACLKEIGENEPVIAGFRLLGPAGEWSKFTGEVWHRLCDSSVGRCKEEDECARRLEVDGAVLTFPRMARVK